MAWGRANKYKAVGVRDEEGRYFPSKGEAGRARDLQLKEKAGLIRDLKFHPSVEIYPGIGWKLDSTYVEVETGIQYWEDFKGVMTGETRLKINIWKYLGPGILRITKGDARTGFFRVDKEYKPKGVERLVEDFKRCVA